MPVPVLLSHVRDVLGVSAVLKSIKDLLAIVKQVFLDELRKLLGSNEAFVVDSLGEVLAVSG